MAYYDGYKLLISTNYLTSVDLVRGMTSLSEALIWELVTDAQHITDILKYFTADYVMHRVESGG
jgi:hypothetical protein